MTAVRQAMPMSSTTSTPHSPAACIVVGSRRRSQGTPAMASVRLYRETLDRIEAGGFDVFGEKTRLSTPRKLAVVARGLFP